MAKGKGLKIIIVGCGKVGETLVDKLSREGHDITIIDKNGDRVQQLASMYDVMGYTGNGASYSEQLEAGIENTDLLIAVTESDELNLLCCTVAKRVADCAAIARVRNPDYSQEVSYLQEKLGLAMIINPELESAREAARILALPTALEVSPFAHGQAERAGRHDDVRPAQARGYQRTDLCRGTGRAGSYSYRQFPDLPGRRDLLCGDQP